LPRWPARRPKARSRARRTSPRQTPKITTNIDATGAIRGQAVTLQVQAIEDQGAISLPAFNVKAGANTLSGAITLDKAFKPSGKIDIDLADIASLAAIANQKAEGALKGSFELASADGKTSAELKLAGAQLRAQGVDISSPTIAVSIADSRLQADRRRGQGHDHCFGRQQTR
jgi:translocation and assembly module TamB